MKNSAKHVDILTKGAKSFGIDLSDDTIASLLLYMEELKAWNKKINLTAITQEKEILTKHFLDSIAPAPYLLKGTSVLDLGSGAGLPGIPLKIIRPDLRVTLLDSSRKKIHFQKHIIRTLKLSEITTVEGRAEDAIKRHPDMLHSYDAVLSRAFSSLRTFIELGRPFLKKTGLLITFKGPAGVAELSELKQWLDQERLPTQISASFRQIGLLFSSNLRKFCLVLTLFRYGHNSRTASWNRSGRCIL
ncbi:MAG: 16S rRNA (guanine(527)-N(7))-methyltransferase RsmG [Deltaproteobacteria bacterium]|nr:16S rRNA (guanine(527)-N(7))-methyltransferase RsmG [Deltaproteobacteria bacterium]